MQGTEKTIRFLRTLTYDGFLSGDEVWLLAKFLNEKEECRNSWPGNLLFPMLHTAFADGELTETEMKLLASTMGSVEQEWRRQKQTEATPVGVESIDDSGEVSLPQLPQVDFAAQVPASSGERTYSVNLFHHACTCPDWANREIWPVGHLGRCCKHIPQAFAKTDVQLDPWIDAVFSDLRYRGKGTHVSDEWMLISLPRRKPILVSGGSGDWYNVFVSTTDEYEQYGYNLPQRRWSYGETPWGAREIENAIKEKFHTSLGL